jgi:hypothetical protein
MADVLLLLLGLALLIAGGAHHAARRPLWLSGASVAGALMLILLCLAISILLAFPRPWAEWIPVVLTAGLLFWAARTIRPVSLVLGIAREPFLDCVRAVLRQGDLDSLTAREIRVDHRPIGVGGIIGPSPAATAQFSALMREQLETMDCGRHRGFTLFTVLAGIAILALSSMRFWW